MLGHPCRNGNLCPESSCQTPDCDASTPAEGFIVDHAASCRALREQVLAQAAEDGSAGPSDRYKGLNNYTDYKKVIRVPVCHPCAMKQ